MIQIILINTTDVNYYRPISVANQQHTQPLTSVDDDQFGTASLVCSVLMLLVAVVGLATNGVVVYIFTRRSLISSINTLLTGLAVADAALLSTAVPLYATVAVYTYWINELDHAESMLALHNAVAYMTVYLYPLTMIFQTFSVWIVVVVTFERYFAIRFPFAARKACTWRRALLALLAVFLSSILYNVCRFWDYRLDSDDSNDEDEEGADGFTVGNISSTSDRLTAVPALRCNRWYMTIYVHWSYFLFVFALPFVVLVFTNASVVAIIRRAQRFRATLTRQQCKEHATATMMVVVALVFLACNSLAFIVNFMDVVTSTTPTSSGDIAQKCPNSQHSSLFYFLIDLNNLLVMTHCSMNFFIYLIFSKRFRTYFFYLVAFGRRRRMRRRSASGSLFDRDQCSSYLSVKNQSIICNGNSIIGNGNSMMNYAPLLTPQISKKCEKNLRLPVLLLEPPGMGMERGVSNEEFYSWSSARSDRRQLGCSKNRNNGHFNYSDRRLRVSPTRTVAEDDF